MVFALIFLGVVGLFLFGFFVGRNNPNLKSVNNLLAAGKAAYDTASNVVKSVKSAAKK